MPESRGGHSSPARSCLFWRAIPSHPQPPRPSLTALRPPNSKLRPPLDSEKKSRLLSTCLRSVLALPPLDELEKHTRLSLELPDVQVRTWHPHPSSERGPQAGCAARPTAHSPRGSWSYPSTCCVPGPAPRAMPRQPPSSRAVSSRSPVPEEPGVLPLPGYRTAAGPPGQRGPVPGTGLGVPFIPTQCPPPRHVLGCQKWAQRAGVSSPGSQWLVPQGSALVASGGRWPGSFLWPPPSLSTPGEPSRKDWGPRV